MKLITDTDYCPVRNFDNVCSLCNCECISGEALTRDCPLIRNGGTPLPKGHGRLVDENKALAGLIFGKHLDDMKCGEVTKIFDASVVIEADKEAENETD